MLFWTLIILKLCLRLFVKSYRKKDIRQFMNRHTIRPVLAGTVPVGRLCPGQSTKKSRLCIQSASIVLYLVHQLPLREYFL